jgi:hypothetical protein
LGFCQARLICEVANVDLQLLQGFIVHSSPKGTPCDYRDESSRSDDLTEAPKPDGVQYSFNANWRVELLLNSSRNVVPETWFLALWRATGSNQGPFALEFNMEDQAMTQEYLVSVMTGVTSGAAPRQKQIPSGTRFLVAPALIFCSAER